MKKHLIFIILFFITAKVYSQDKELKFNHIYFVLDSTSYNKLKYDNQLFKLINIDKGLPTFDKIDSTSNILYLRGKSTYVEIMGPNNRFEEKIGSIGLGFSWDTHNINNNNFSLKLKESSDVKFLPYEAKRTFNNKEVIWYTAFYSRVNSSLSTWYAYYNPEFLSHLYKKNYSTFTREAFLQEAYNEAKPLYDLAEIKIECSDQDFKEITAEINNFYIRKKKIKSNSAVFYIGDVKLILIKTSREKSYLKSIKFTSKNRLGESTTELGKVELIKKNKEIHFNFK